MKALFAGTRITRQIISILATLASLLLSSAALAAPDADGDGMPDAWETGYGFNPYDAADAADDTDTDGFSNLDEYRTGTDPLDLNSWPAATTAWFESFENGVPADWDTSSDATSDGWSRSIEHATDGDYSLRAPQYSEYTAATDTLSVTRNFAAGMLTADYAISKTLGVWVRVQVDGVDVLHIRPVEESELGGSISVNVPDGIHTVTFNVWRPVWDYADVYFDSVRFQSSSTDSDNDGLPDVWEFQHGLNPNDAADASLDGDGDGLDNVEEYNAGTSITNADTDGDGLHDGDEVVVGSNALITDTDFDGLPDGWEVDNGLDPLNMADALGDNDGDGFSNLDEYRLKTNPQDADSVPQKIRRWFESFENGVPADASSDGTSDASSDGWGLMSSFSTHGSYSLQSPFLNISAGSQSRTLTFTRYFEAGTVTADMMVASWSGGVGEMLVDGVSVATVAGGLSLQWSHLSAAIPEGVHSVAFRVTGYPSSPITDVVLPIMLVDSIHFVWAGDSDGDGIGDRDEIDHGLNPDDPSDASADYDGDGLTNAQEIALGSNFNDPDSDDDGLNDADEVELGTNPVSGDSDGDGMPDAYEVGNDLDPLNSADGALDNDGDGASNYDEFYLHTDPNDPASFPQVTKRWFESFEAGVPADWDASTDTPDATTDGWTVTSEFATDGAQSLKAPDTAGLWSYLYRTDQISFSKLFDEGRLSFDVKLQDSSWYSSVQVDVDGYVYAYLYSPGQQRISIDLPAGAHKVTISRWMWVYPYGDGQNFYIDNVRFISSGDSDGDGLSDQWEFDNGFNPDDAADAQLDGDNDGLTNAEEYLAGTNPNDADSDDDGISDGDEIVAGTSPLQIDSDSDGIPDGFELANGLDPLDGSDGASDSDGDGFSNIEEFRVGTNPQDAASVPQIVTSWCESFENGMPENWDSSTDASADSANWPWQTSQQYVTDGSHSLQSPALPSGKTSQIYVSRYFAEGTLSFDFIVGSGSYYCCNNFIVTVDGVEQIYAYDGYSGRRFLQLTEGVHEIRFSYRHFAYDYYPADGADANAVWIDNLRFEQGPIQQDSDHDGLPDAWEYANGTSPWDEWDADYDYDNDGLSNRQEFLAGTSIFDEDSDDDGLSDAEEVDVIGSDPLDSDSDDDGLPDAWEAQNGLDPVNAADANEDADGDGFSNYQEFLWGTAANDPAEPALQQSWFESFEAGFPADWDASGDTSSDASTDASSDAPWELSTVKKVPHGVYRLRSGAIRYLQNSAVSVSKFLQAGVLFFDYQVSSHPKDTLSLYINGELKLTDKYSVANKRAEVELEGGYEQLKFVFNKNTKLSFANNAAFIDKLEFFAHGFDGDFDGMEDIWERRNGLDPYDSTDALLDADHDRISNLQEFRNGTDPQRYNRLPKQAAAANDGGSGSDPILPSVSANNGGGGGAAGLLLLGMAGLAWQRSRKRT